MTTARALKLTGNAQTSEAPDDGALDLLRALLAEIRGLRMDLAPGGNNQSRIPNSILSRGDRAVLAKLLPAAGGVFGSEPFLTRDLFESDAAAVKLVTRGLNVRQVGRLFRRGEGYAIEGYAIHRDGEELNAILWRILRAK